MAIICEDLKLLFIMPPATGCSVLGGVLQKQFGGRYLPEQDIRSNGRHLSRKHNSLPQLFEHQVLTVEERDQLLVFATIRNPFDRWVTYYQRLVGEWTEEYDGFAWRQI